MTGVRITCAALALLLVSCATPKGWREDPGSSALVYEPLDLSFPARFEDLVRAAPHLYDESGRDTSIQYNGTTRRFALTFYINPRPYAGSSDPEFHFRDAVGAVLQQRPGAAVDRAAAGPLPLGEMDVDGYHALLHWSEPDRDWGSIVILIPQPEHFFKLRVSVELDGSPEPMAYAWGISERFLRSLAFKPDRSQARSRSAPRRS